MMTNNYMKILVTMFLITGIYAKDTHSSKKALSYRKSPYSVSSPKYLLDKSKNNTLDLFNYGFDTTLNAGYDTKYNGTDNANFTANSLKFKLGYAVAPFINFYSESLLDTSFAVAKTDIVPMFVNRMNNSNLTLYQGYILFGDLKESSFYTYFGQVRLPYGASYSPKYVSNISSRINTIVNRALSLGYNYGDKDNLINTEFFMFNGDTIPYKVSNTNNNKPNTQPPTYGFNLTAHANLSSSSSIAFTGGVLSNIADTNGFQKTTSSINSTALGQTFDYDDEDFEADNDYDTSGTISNNQPVYYYKNFLGFATGGSFENIYKRVPGASLALKINMIKDITLSGSYSSALTSFDYRDLSFASDGSLSSTTAPTSSQGARPSVWNIYVNKGYAKKWNFYTGYESTAQALALSVPESRFILGLNNQLTDFTAIALEYRKDTNYSATSYAYGPTNKNVSNTGLVNTNYTDTNQVTYSLIPQAGTKELGNSSSTYSVAVKVSF